VQKGGDPRAALARTAEPAGQRRRDDDRPPLSLPPRDEVGRGCDDRLTLQHDPSRIAARRRRDDRPGVALRDHEGRDC
jgi:hypothetical protein